MLGKIGCGWPVVKVRGCLLVFSTSYKVTSFHYKRGRAKESSKGGLTHKIKIGT